MVFDNKWSFCSKKKYSNPDWISKNQFVVHSLRIENEKPIQKVIATWGGNIAAEAHEQTVPMLAAYGVIDLYSCLEEFIFNIYRIFHNYNPDLLLKGDEQRELRKLFKKQKDDNSYQSEWDSKWKERLDSWQKKQLYRGLDKVFFTFCELAQLKTPLWCKATTIKTWAETINGIGLLRHCLTHGVQKVPTELC